MTWDKCTLIGIKCVLFCGDYKDVFMTAIAIIWSSTSDTMLCSKKSIIKSCQEGTFYLGEKNELKSEREFDQCKDPEPVQMIPHESQNHYIN